MKDSTLSTIVFAVVFGIVCAVLLTAVDLATARFREENKAAERRKTILAVLGRDVPAGAGRVNEVFKKCVEIEERDGFVIYRERKTLAVAVPFRGKGLWGPIEGFLALDPDLRTVRGVRFYRHEETPGLGGEISSKEFCAQFVGKTIKLGGKAGVKITKPSVPGPRASNEVDGISGATMTSARVEVILNRTITKIVQTGRRNGK